MYLDALVNIASAALAVTGALSIGDDGAFHVWSGISFQVSDCGLSRLKRLPGAITKTSLDGD